jgi:hypothetical protein
VVTGRARRAKQNYSLRLLVGSRSRAIRHRAGLASAISRDKWVVLCRSCCSREACEEGAYVTVRRTQGTRRRIWRSACCCWYVLAGSSKGALALRFCGCRSRKRSDSAVLLRLDRMACSFTTADRDGWPVVQRRVLLPASLFFRENNSVVQYLQKKKSLQLACCTLR